MVLESSNRNALAIVRTSDVRQEGNLSFPTQKHVINLKAEQEGYEIIEFIEEPSQSAYKKKSLQRKGMQQLLSKALDNALNIQAIFFYDESRVSRQFEDFILDIYNTIINEKPYFQFFSTNSPGEWNPYDITSIINLANASQESIIKSQRAKDAQKTKFKRKERPGADAPFGYKLDGLGNLIIVKEDAGIVVLIFFLTSWGHSQDKIAKVLNNQEIPSPRGKKWSGKTVEYILNNDTYLGHLPWNINESRNSSRKKQCGEYDLIANFNTPIISPLLWHLAHQSIELHKTNGGNNKTKYIFRNLLYCSKCKIQLIATDYSTKSKEYYYYKCEGCNCKIDIKEIRKDLLKELGQNLFMKASTIKEQIKKSLKKRESLILKYLEVLQSKLKNANYCKELLGQNSNYNTNPEWDFVISTSISSLKKDLHNTNRFAELVNILSNDKSLEETITRLTNINYANLYDAELRTLVLTYFKEVRVDFENKKYPYVSYNLTPFANLEDYLDQIG